MTDPNPLSRNYRGHKIEFSPSDLKFHVTGPEFDIYKAEYCIFPSFDEARVKVDHEVEGAEKLKAQNIKFKETVLDSNGNAARYWVGASRPLPIILLEGQPTMTKTKAKTKAAPTPPKALQPSSRQDETAHDRFIRLADYRFWMIVRYVRALGRLGASSHDLHPEDIDKLQKALFIELNDAMTLLRHGTVARVEEDIL